MNKLIKCKSCGTEIAKSAKTCPQCGAKNKKPIFKRWWFWAIVAIIILSISSGSNEEDSTDKPNSDSTGNSSPITDTTNTDSQNFDVAIKEAVLYNEDGICITVKGMEETFVGVDIKLLVENSTENNIAVGCSDFVINGITVGGHMYIEVAADKKANGEISLYNTNLKTAGITHISTINSHDAYISDTDTFMKTKSISLAMVTTLSDYTQKIDDSGEVLFQQDGITIIAKSLTKDFSGGTITVLIKNESGQDILVQADNISVNGYTISTLHSDDVCDGTVRFSEIDLYQSYLEENDIEDIENATFELSILNPKTYATLFKTGELQMSASD